MAKKRGEDDERIGRIAARTTLPRFVSGRRRVSRQSSSDLLVRLAGDRRGRFMSSRAIFRRLGFPTHKAFRFADLASHIEVHNELAEVEGRETFLVIPDPPHRPAAQAISCSTFPSVIRRAGLWTIVALEAITRKDDRPQLVYGRVVYQTFRLPHEIVHYQRTYRDALTQAVHPRDACAII
ncbi:MAG: hypothetical protein MZU84_07400 [Sphingobacterium sp.]|nr:hypothetical protein [Sphingobacterium sp.]